jgi:hypothetical protein
MANGRPRSKSVQTCRVQPALIQSFRLSWSEPSNTRDSQEVGATGGGESASVVKQLPPPDNLLSSPPTGTQQPAVLDTYDFYLHAQEPFQSENDLPRMLHSPVESYQGSTNNDKTPRLHPVADSSVRQFPATSGKELRQDSAYESATGNPEGESWVDVDTQAVNIRARGRVELLRARVFRTRPAISESRQELQLLRENLRTATDRLMRAIDALMTSKEHMHNLETLAPLYQDLRAAQDDLGPAEDAYDLLEMRLNREEIELEQEEMHFYTHNNIALRLPPNIDLDKPLTPLAKPYEPEDAEFSSLNLDNELVKQYLANVSEAEDLKEKLDELENEQYRLTQELSFRTRYNIPLSKDNSAFRSAFPEAHRELLEKLLRSEDALSELRDRCIEGGLFADSDYVYERRDALVEEIHESMTDAMERNPLHVAAQHMTTHKEHKVDFADKQDYVNTWLLEWVQESPVEAVRLKTIILFKYPLNGEVLEDDRWSELALEFWNKDGAGAIAKNDSSTRKLNTIAEATGIQEPSTAHRTGNSSSFGSFPSSLGSLDVDPNEDTSAEAEIMGSETGSYRTQKEASPETPTAPQRPRSAPPKANFRSSPLDFSLMRGFASMEKFSGK